MTPSQSERDFKSLALDDLREIATQQTKSQFFYSAPSAPFSQIQSPCYVVTPIHASTVVMHYSRHSTILTVAASADGKGTNLHTTAATR
jgi:hypothetical protein